MVKIGAEGHEMGDERHRGLDYTTAERLMSGEHLDPTRLADLFADATLPGHPSEFAGEQRALAAFRAAQAVASRNPAAYALPWTRRAGLVARWGVVKILVVACIVALLGLTFASVTGVVPNPLIDDRPVSTQSPTRTATVPVLIPGATIDKPAPSATTSSVQATLAGLCRSYLEASDHTNVRDNPAFSRLVEAAGDAERVAAYCAVVEAGQQSNLGSSGDPGVSGSHEPKDHSTGPPSPRPESSH